MKRHLSYRIAGLSVALLSIAAACGQATPAAPPPVEVSQVPTLEMRVTANLRLITVMESYAEALASARDEVSAGAAAVKIDAIAKEAVMVGAEVLKLGKPTPEMQAAIAQNPEIVQAGKRMITRTRAAAQALSAAPKLSAVLKPAMRNFQQAMGQLQQDALAASMSGNPPAPAPVPPATASRDNAPAR